MGNRSPSKQLQAVSQDVPTKLMSRFILKDPEIEKFLDENEEKILALRKWAASEITKEPMDRESEKTKLASLLENASTKVDMEWFFSIDHPKKGQLKDMVMLDIQCTGMSILDNDPFVVDELLGAKKAGTFQVNVFEYATLDDALGR
jgi:hypothetical protein